MMTSFHPTGVAGRQRTGVVVPAYNEAANISALLEAIRVAVPDSLIVVVDDSPDHATVDAVNSAELKDVTVVHRAAKGGRGSAVIEGLRILLREGCERIVEMDADFSHDPSEMPAMLSALDARQLSMVIGSRYLPASRIERWPLSRRLFSRAANIVAATLLRVPIHDYTNGFRVYTLPAARIVAETCGQIGSGFIPLSETLVNLWHRGYAIGEVPSVFVNRARGESSINARELSNAVIGIVKIFFLGRRLMKRQRTEVRR
jgi:dolichol-phosphate mannosyltransferase